MKTLHNTKNCNYRRFLHKRLKDGKISGQFYRFLCRNFPYRLTYHAIDMNVREVMRGNINESTAINTLKEKEKLLSDLTTGKSQPAAFAIPAFSSVETVPITVAPKALAH